MSDLLSNISWKLQSYDPALFQWEETHPPEWDDWRNVFKQGGVCTPAKEKYISPNYKYEIPSIGAGQMATIPSGLLFQYLSKTNRTDPMFEIRFSNGITLRVITKQNDQVQFQIRNGTEVLYASNTLSASYIQNELWKMSRPDQKVVYFTYVLDYTYQLDTTIPRNNFGFVPGGFVGDQWESTEFPFILFPAPTDQQSQNIYNALLGAEVNPDIGPENEGDGENDADFNYVDETIDFPDLPATDGLSTGIISLYKMNTGTLNSLSRMLWDDNFFNTIVKNFDSPLENIISLNILPVNVSGTEAEVMVGNFMTSVIGEKIHGQFIDLDGGSVHVQKIFGHQFDFKPVNELQIYIPYIGYRSLDLDDCIGGELYLKYRIDLLTGNLLAMIRVVNDPDRYDHDSVEYYFEGNCASSLPLCGANYMNYYGSLIGGAMRAASGIATGSAMQGLSGASSMISAKPEYSRSGAIRGNFGFMGPQTAFIMMASPVSGIAGNLQTEKGLRSNRYAKFSDLTGYQKINAFHPNSALSSECTEEEIAEIENLLKEGVFF